MNLIKNFFSMPFIDGLLSSTSIIVSSISLVLMSVIWRVQKKGEKNREKIQSNTSELTKNINEITEGLRSEKLFKDNVEKFFLLDKKEYSSAYNLIYPTTYKRRPLPSIHQGDFYAIYIVGKALDITKVNLRDISVISQNCIRNNSKNCMFEGGNNIFICGPQTNPCLDSLLPYAIGVSLNEKNILEDELNNKEINVDCSKNSKKRDFLLSDEDTRNWLNRIDMPCWFIHTADSDRELKLDHLTKKITHLPTNEVGAFQEPIKSPAEEFYIAASKTDEIVDTEKVHDYGILARRKNKEGGVDIIISGIHQYGTWIVAEFLNAILSKRNYIKNRETKDAIMGGEDFVAIIEGTYNASIMEVDKEKMRLSKLWQRSEDMSNWIRQDGLR